MNVIEISSSIDKVITINSSVPQKKSINKDSLKISTNKNTYSIKENILITFQNLANGKIEQNKNSSLNVKCRQDIGDNYDVAFIEHQINNEWIAIEPVNRCSDDCTETCSTSNAIQANKKTIFSWNQTLLKCLNKETSHISEAPTGAYRVSSATWDKDKKTFKKIYSNIFKISNLSKR